MSDGGHAFTQALTWLKGGRKITRKGWNGKGMFIYLVQSHDTQVSDYWVDTKPLISIFGEGRDVNYQARIDMKFANGQIGIWTPSHEDILAEDWNLLQ